jgi:chromosome segregation ATPase
VQLKRQAESSVKNHEDFIQASKHAIEAREEHWKNEAQRLQKLNENDSARIKKFEADRSSLSQLKRDLDTVKARNQDLEDKIKRQEQFMKTRLLRDRGSSSNSLSAPEGSSKQPKPCSGTSSLLFGAGAGAARGGHRDIRTNQL